MLTRTKKVSRRAETQEALRKSESRFRALIENSFDAIVLNNQEGRITYASPSIQRILGYTPEECLGLLAAQAIHPDDQEPTATLFAHLLATRKSTVTTQYRVRHKNGSWRWIEGTWNNLLSTPEVAAVVINLHDITEQKAAQEREHYLARLSESVSDAIISTDLNYLIRSWNTAAERLYGWNEGEVLGTTALALFTDAQFVAGSPEEFRASLATKGCWQGELIQNTRTGQDVHVLASVSTITTTVGQPVGLVTVNRDITERKTLERKLHEQATLLQVANDAFLVQTQENIITFWNQGAQNLYGWSEAEALGKRASTLLNTQFPAIKYSPQADTVLVRVAKDQQQVTISVQDFGMGIAKEHHEKIFERFYQVSHPGQHPFSGLGIGLYLASEIIKRHAGRIWVESSKGQGATFSFTLPLTQEAQSSGLLGEGGCQGEGCV